MAENETPAPNERKEGRQEARKEGRKEGGQKEETQKQKPNYTEGEQRTNEIHTKYNELKNEHTATTTND